MRLRTLSVPFLLTALLPCVVWANELSFAAKGAGTGTGSSASLVAFWLFGVLTLAGAVTTITRRNPVSAALFLVFTLFCTGGLYLVLHATFLAAIQVLVYAGAIMVLFIFVVMAVARYDAEEFGFSRGFFSKTLGLLALGLFAERLIRVLTGTEAPNPGLVPDGFGDVRSIGKLLFSDYLLPFEALSLLLLVAIVGAVMVTRRASADERDEPRSASASKAEAEAGGPREQGAG